MIFPYKWEWNVIIPIDELILFKGVGQPPTRVVFSATVLRDVHGFPMISIRTWGMSSDVKFCFRVDVWPSLQWDPTWMGNPP